MSNLTTYCSDCLHNHTDKCMDSRKNSWCCPDFVKKMSEHEIHLLKIAKTISDLPKFCEICPTQCEIGYEKSCEEQLYEWLMSIKEE